MIAIVHQLPRIDNNHVSDHSADALTAKALCDIFVWSEKAKFFLWWDKVVNTRVLGHTIQDIAALYGMDTMPIPYNTYAVWYQFSYFWTVRLHCNLMCYLNY